MIVADPQTLQPVPSDGTTMGEIFFRGNITMKGYLKNPKATRRGIPRRLVSHGRPGGGLPRRLRQDQGPLQGHHHLRRREHLHPRGRGCALPPPGGAGGRGRGATGREVGRDARVPSSRSRADAGPVTQENVIAFCRERLAHYKCPRTVVFGPLPKTSTGKIQKNVLREQAKTPLKHDLIETPRRRNSKTNRQKRTDDEMGAW